MPRPTSVLMRGTIAAVLLLLVSSTPAVAAPRWSGYAWVSDGERPLLATVVDDFGRAVAFFSTWSDDPAPGALYAARRTSSGGWGSQVRISPPGVTQNVSVVVDGAGVVTAAYATYLDGRSHVFASTFVPGSGWSAPRRLSPDGVDAFGARVAVNRDGRAAVAWEAQRYDRTRRWVQSTSRTGTGRWAPVTVHAGNGDEPARLFDVAVDERGRQAVAFGEHGVRLRRTTADGRWGRVRLAVSERRRVGEVSIAFAASEVVVSWLQEWGPVNSGKHVLRARAHRPRTGWSTPYQLSAAGSTVSQWRLLLDPRRRATAVWPSGTSYRFALRSADGHWASSRRLLPPGEASRFPEIGMDARGRVHAAWLDGSYVGWKLRGPNGSWSRKRVMNDYAHGNAHHLRMDVADRGQVLLVWKANQPHWSRLRSAP